MSKQYYTTKDKADNYDVTMPLLKAMYVEFKAISSKKPDSAVSKSKIKITNRLLEKVREVLKDSSAIDFLDLLDEDDIPQASDVILILSQYVAAMETFYTEHHGFYNGEHQWIVK